METSRTPRILPRRSLLSTLALWLCLSSSTLVGCGDETAIDLTLVPDPNINSETALLDRLVSLELVIDSAEGLYPLSDVGKRGNLEIADVDGDGQAELIATVALPALGRLPVIRISRGGLPDAPLELRIDGLGNDKSGKTLLPLAAGGVRGVSFLGEEITPIKVPFNLRATYRPPRVTRVFPEDGATLGSAGVSSVLLIFSKPMNPASLTKKGVIEVLSVVDGKEQLVPAKEIAPGELYAGGPSRVEYRFAEYQDGGTFRVRVDTAALDVSGRRLDQVPMQGGNQLFSSQFSLLAAVPAVTCPQPGCTPWCGQGAKGSCPGSARCDEMAGCLPTACPATCPDSTICNPARAICVPDCRPHGTYGGCPSEQTCQADTGLCSTP